MARTEAATLQLLLLSISCYMAITAVVSDEQKPSLHAVISDPILSDAYESKVLKQPTETLLDVPWWPTFITNMINTFNRDSLSEISQFGFIYMASITDLDQEFNGHFYPHDNDGRPVIEADTPISPPDIEMFGNYVVSSPDEVTDGTIYAEGMLLDHIDELWKAYPKRFKQIPNFILHYSRTQPGKASTTSIVNRMSRFPFDKVAYRVVAYTLAAENVLPDPTLIENKDKEFNLTENSLVVYHQQCVGSDKREEPLENYGRVLEKDGSLSLADAVKLLRKSLIDEEKNTEPDNSEMGTCQLADLLQGCLSNCIDELLTCKCDATKKRTSIASIINKFTFSCARSDFGECTNKWIEDNIGLDDACINQKKLQDILATCNPKCSGKPLSNPLDPKDPTSYPDVLSVFSNLANFHRPQQSDMCSDGNGEQMKRAMAYKTVGNEYCRSGHHCAYHSYSYAWCYTSSNWWGWSWDYCCTCECGYHEQAYKWCSTGQTWQYC